MAAHICMQHYTAFHGDNSQWAQVPHASRKARTFRGRMGLESRGTPPDKHASSPMSDLDEDLSPLVINARRVAPRPVRGYPLLLATLFMSLLLNMVGFVLMSHDLLKFNHVAFKRMFTKKATGPKPAPYNLFHHIAAYGQMHVQPSCINQSFLAPPQFRDDLGHLLESLGGFHVGVELGVQAGQFSHRMLSTWPSCKKYYLVDLWGEQTNYADSANVQDEEQLQVLEQAQHALANFTTKTVFLRSLTTEAAKVIPDQLDFVYVDARHDQCGVWADLIAWWPKVRPGGIIAGHDYRGASAVWPHSDWSLCENGKRFNGAVMGAVNEFAMTHGLQVLATWGRAEWSSWMIRKPLYGGACKRLGSKKTGTRKRHSFNSNTKRLAAEQ